MKKLNLEKITNESKEGYLFLIISIVFLILLVCLLSNNVLADNNTFYTTLVNVTESSPANTQNMVNLKTSASLQDNSNLEEVSSAYIKESVSDIYFNNHFVFKQVDNRGPISYIQYEFNYESYTTEMQIAYDNNGKKIIPQMSSYIKHPADITFLKDQADSKVDELGLPTPRKVALIYVSEGDNLAWKIEWDHQPSNEERINNTIGGYVINAEAGNLIDTLRYHIELTAPTNENSPETKVTIASFFKEIFDSILKYFKIK